MAHGKLRVFLALSLLNLSQGMHAQGIRALAMANYGFGAQSLRPEYSNEQKSDATGIGFLVGTAYDTEVDTIMHFRIRLAWQRTYWEQEFRSTYTHYLSAPYDNGLVRVDGTVSSRIDEVIVTPVWVLPIGERVYALLAADLGLIVDSSVHDRSQAELIVPGDGGTHGGDSSTDWTTDSIGTGQSYLNAFQFGLSAGLEMHFGRQFATGAEFSVNTSSLVSYSQGAPPKYFRLFLGYRLANKR